MKSRGHMHGGISMRSGNCVFFFQLQLQLQLQLYLLKIVLQ